MDTHKKLTEPRVISDVIDDLFTVLEEGGIVQPGHASLTDVPSRDYGAKLAAWARVLAQTEQKLHARRKEYTVLAVDEGGDAQATLSKNLLFTVRRLTKEIIHGNKSAVMLTKVAKTARSKAA